MSSQTDASTTLNVQERGFTDRTRTTTRTTESCEEEEPGDLQNAIQAILSVPSPQSVVMDMMGHKTTAMFKRYNITSNEDILDAQRRRRRYIEQQDTKSNVLPMELAKLS